MMENWKQVITYIFTAIILTAAILLAWQDGQRDNTTFHTDMRHVHEELVKGQETHKANFEQVMLVLEEIQERQCDQ